MEVYNVTASDWTKHFAQSSETPMNREHRLIFPDHITAQEGEGAMKLLSPTEGAVDRVKAQIKIRKPRKKRSVSRNKHSRAGKGKSKGRKRAIQRAKSNKSKRKGKKSYKDIFNA